MQNGSKERWLTTNNPAIIFEDNAVGRLKKQIWETSEEELGAILDEYGILESNWGNRALIFRIHRVFV